LLQAEQEKASAREAFLQLHTTWLKLEQETIEATSRAEAAESTVQALQQKIEKMTGEYQVKCEDYTDLNDVAREFDRHAAENLKRALAAEATIRQVAQEMREQENICRNVYPNGTQSRGAKVNLANWLRRWSDTLQAAIVPDERKG
jgi:chromosome segregation ATPase